MKILIIVIASACIALAYSFAGHSDGKATTVTAVEVRGPQTAFQKERRSVYLTGANRLVLWNGQAKMIDDAKGYYSGDLGCANWLSQELRTENHADKLIVIVVCWGDARAGYRRWLENVVDAEVKRLNAEPGATVWLAGMTGYVVETKVRSVLPDLPPALYQLIEDDSQ